MSTESKASSKHRKLTQAELIAMATGRFGEDWKKWAFRCPNCGDVASFADFEKVGADAAGCGQHCIGRHMGALDKTKLAKAQRGCDWTAYGLLRGPWEVVVPADENGPERSIWSFPLAEVQS
jgi:hypothetical protein